MNLNTHEPDASSPTGASNTSTLDRRRVVTGLAWATPAVLTVAAAPAYAASRCLPVVADWRPSGLTGTIGDNSYTVRALNERTIIDSRLIGGDPTNTTEQTSGFPRDDTWHHPTPSDFAEWNPDGRGWLMLRHAGRNQEARGGGQDLTISFSKPVRDVEFFIYQIDGNSLELNQYRDAVIITATPPANAVQQPTIDLTTYDRDRPTTLQINSEGGSVADVHSTATLSDLQALIGFQTDRGTVRVQVAGEVQTLTLRYTNRRNWNLGASALENDCAIFISRLRYEAC